MNEFEILKAMLERTGVELNITIWEILNQSLIEDITNHTEYWFTENLLTDVVNVR